MYSNKVTVPLIMYIVRGKLFYHSITIIYLAGKFKGVVSALTSNFKEALVS